MQRIRGRMPHLAIILVLLASLPTVAQVTGTENFRLDPTHPWAYIKFDHIGPGIQRSPEELRLRIWLTLNNNCTVPISVGSFGIPQGSPSDEQSIMHLVVANPPPMELMLFGPGETYRPATSDELPRGYMFDVGSSLVIEPGEGVLFSVPINHVSDQWHIEIPFYFEFSRSAGPPRDPSVSLGPTMSLVYGLSDVPPESRSQVVAPR